MVETVSHLKLRELHRLVRALEQAAGLNQVQRIPQVFSLHLLRLEFDLGT